MSQGCALLILGSKGQRSRSWRMVIWKWFPDDNWLCNQPMIMKLHTLTPHESRMCPIDFGVKRSTVKVMAHGYLKMVHRNNGCRFEFVGVGGGPVLLQQYFQYAFICCPYMLPLLFLQQKQVKCVPVCLCFLAHLSWRLKWAIVIAHRPSSVRPSSSSVNFSHFQLLLQNRLMDFDETWYAWSTHGPLQVLLFFGQIRPGIQDGAKIGHGESPSSRNFFFRPEGYSDKPNA